VAPRDHALGDHFESSFTKMKVSVVCPFFNEEAVIRQAAHRMVDRLNKDFGHDWELILVNDGSTDASLENVLHTLPKLDSQRIRIMSLPLNQGRGRALKAGIDTARGELIVTTEADGSWGEDIVRRLVEELDLHPEADFVVASPHLPGGGLANVPLTRRLLTSLGNRLIRAFFTSNLTMNTGMTRGYRREVLQPLPTIENGKEFHLEVLLKLLTLGFCPREIPATITWPDRRRSKRERRRRSSTRILRTIGTHLQFLTIAQPTRYFAFATLSALLLGAGFVGTAGVRLLLGIQPAIYYALVGFLLLLFALCFAGFSVVFSQLRHASRENLMRHYPKPWPPSARRGFQVFPPSSEVR
jgi:glycosyltransferase involved in cell wall biosynthesis